MWANLVEMPMPRKAPAREVTILLVMVQVYPKRLDFATPTALDKWVFKSQIEQYFLPNFWHICGIFSAKNFWCFH